MAETPTQPERDRTWMVKDPILTFVVDGVRYAVEQNMMTRQEAQQKILDWFPDAQIILAEQVEIDGRQV